MDFGESPYYREPVQLETDLRLRPGFCARVSRGFSTQVMAELAGYDRPTLIDKHGVPVHEEASGRVDAQRASGEKMSG